MKHQGITLIELMIALSIVGIMLAFALPNYSEHLIRQRRLSAETNLMKVAGHLEAYFAEHNTYEGASFHSLRLPEFTEGEHYRLMISANAAQFKVTAIPQDEQARHDGKCGSLVLNSNGVKRVTGYGELNQCW